VKNVCRLESITAVIVNYRTERLTERCVETLLRYYPDVHLILIDNGSQDGSTDYIMDLSIRKDTVTCIINEENLYHGPAMDQGIRSSTSRYVFILDSDCEILKGGFLEKMLVLFNDPNLYAVGRLTSMDRYGYETELRSSRVVRYVHPSAMLIDRHKYLRLSGFVHHGSPCLRNMKEAERQGYGVCGFPVHEFVLHYGRGTCSRYGYGLGPRTSIERLLSKLGISV